MNVDRFIKAVEQLNLRTITDNRLREIRKKCRKLQFDSNACSGIRDDPKFQKLRNIKWKCNMIMVRRDYNFEL